MFKSQKFRIETLREIKTIKNSNMYGEIEGRKTYTYQYTQKHTQNQRNACLVKAWIFFHACQLLKMFSCKIGQ